MTYVANAPAPSRHLPEDHRRASLAPRGGGTMYDGDAHGYPGVLSYMPFSRIPLVPQYNRLLLRGEQIERFTEGGLELPAELLEREELFSAIWQVIAVGPTTYRAVALGGIALLGGPDGPPDSVPRLGDWVHVTQYAGQKAREVKGKDEEFRTWRLIQESEILAISRPGVKLDHRVR